MWFMNLKSYILWDLFICLYDEKKFDFAFYFILCFHFMIYDLLIMREKEMSVYVLEKNIKRIYLHTFV